MKLFPQSELKSAFLFAEKGGQALLLARPTFARVGAMLIDHNTDRLFETARRLGWRKDRIFRLGDAGQNVVLVGKAFHRAVAECRAMELEFTTP